MSNYPRWRWYEPKGRNGPSHVCEQSTTDGRLLVDAVVSEIVYLCGKQVNSWQGMRRSYDPRHKCSGCLVGMNESILKGVVSG